MFVLKLIAIRRFVGFMLTFVRSLLPVCYVVIVGLRSECFWRLWFVVCFWVLSLLL